MGAFSDFTSLANETGARLSDQPLLFEITRRLDVTQQELFNYVTDFDRLSEWIWASKKTWADNTNAEVPGQVGSVRMIQGAFGKPFREVVKAFEAPRMLAYSAPNGALLGLCSDAVDQGTLFRLNPAFLANRRADRDQDRGKSAGKVL